MSASGQRHECRPARAAPARPARARGKELPWSLLQEVVWDRVVESPPSWRASSSPSHTSPPRSARDDPPPAKPAAEAGLRRLRGRRRRQGRQRPRRRRHRDQLPGERPPQDDRQGRSTARTCPNSSTSSPGDPNHLAKFDFAIMAPNNWAGAGIEIKGQARRRRQDAGRRRQRLQEDHLPALRQGRRDGPRRGDQPRPRRRSAGRLSADELQGEARPEHLRGRAEGAGAARRGSTSRSTQEDPAEADRAEHHAPICEDRAGPREGMLIVDNVAFEK